MVLIILCEEIRFSDFQIFNTFPFLWVLFAWVTFALILGPGGLQYGIIICSNFKTLRRGTLKGTQILKECNLIICCQNWTWLKWYLNLLLFIDLIITDQSNLDLDSVVRDSLNSTVQHKIVFCKINFKISPPPTYSRIFYYFNRAKKVSIQTAVSKYPW